MRRGIALLGEGEGITPGKMTFFAGMICLFFGQVAPFAAFANTAACPATSLRVSQLEPISSIVEKAIRDGKTPGAVVLVGNQGEIVYRRAFGYRALEPKKIPMTEDTIFDLASLTKAIATTTAIMQLAEQKKLDIEAPVVRYWPAFGKNGKGKITVRQLLSHYSGLRPDLSLKPAWSGYQRALEKIIAERPVIPPGTGFIYSDINFEVLGELVRRISGTTLDTYCAEHIFEPLGMKDTGFRPPPSLHSRIAPTQYRHGKLLCGEAHDPSCYRMGGVAGHAGLFSTADDLSIFAQMLLSGGSYLGRHILTSKTVDKMTTPQSPPGKKNLRGLGWDLQAPFASSPEELSAAGAYGHLGYTGTALWIDSITDTYIIVLTNRVHPDGKGDVKELRAQIKKIVADSLAPISLERVLPASSPVGNPYCYSRAQSYASQDLRQKTVTGMVDVLSGN